MFTEQSKSPYALWQTLCCMFTISFFFFKGKQKAYISQPLLGIFCKHMTESGQSKLDGSILSHFQMWFLKTLYISPSYVPSTATNGSVTMLKELKMTMSLFGEEPQPRDTQSALNFARERNFYIFMALRFKTLLQPILS